MTTRKQALTLMETALTAVSTRNVAMLRRTLREMSDLLGGQQLINIAAYYEREHGIAPVAKTEAA